MFRRDLFFQQHFHLFPWQLRHPSFHRLNTSILSPATYGQLAAIFEREPTVTRQPSHEKKIKRTALIKHTTQQRRSLLIHGCFSDQQIHFNARLCLMETLEARGFLYYLFKNNTTKPVCTGQLVNKLKCRRLADQEKEKEREIQHTVRADESLLKKHKAAVEIRTNKYSN